MITLVARSEKCKIILIRIILSRIKVVFCRQIIDTKRFHNTGKVRIYGV